MEILIEKWLDNSKMGAFERCPREFLLRYILHLDKKTEKGQVALAFGKAFHYGCEIYFQNIPHDDRQQVLQTAISKATEQLQQTLSELASIGSEEIYSDPRADIDFLARTLSYFFTSGAGKELSDMTLEAKPEVHMEWEHEDTGWKLVGKADLILQTLSKSTIVIDFKTTRWTIKTQWGTKAQTDTQLSTYCLLAKTTGLVNNIDAVAYAVIRADRRQLKNGQWSPSITLESDFFPVAITQDHLDRALFRFIRIVNSVDTSDLENPEPKSFPPVFSSCQRLGGNCKFFPLCELTWKSEDIEEIREVALRLDYKEDRWHPFEQEEQD